MKFWRGLLIAAGGAFGWLSLGVITGLADTVAPSKLLVARVAVVLLGTLLVALGLLLPLLGRWLERTLESRFAGAQDYPRRADKATLFERAMAASLLLLMVLMAWLASVAPDTVTRLVAEDGPVEYLTAIAYLIAAAITAVTAVRSRSRRLLAVNLGLLAALMFVVAMEEISWGQRLIGFSSPAALAQANVQDEFNFHNVWSTSVAQFGGLLVSGAILGLLPLLHATTRWFPGVGRVLQIPVAPLSVSALYGGAMVAFVSVGSSLGTLGVGPFSTSGRAPHLDDEVLEVLLAGLFLMASVATWSVDVARFGAAQRPSESRRAARIPGVSRPATETDDGGTGENEAAPAAGHKPRQAA